MAARGTAFDGGPSMGNEEGRNTEDAARRKYEKSARRLDRGIDKIENARGLPVLMNERLVDAVRGRQEWGGVRTEKNEPLEGGTLVRGETTLERGAHASAIEES